MEEKIMMSLPDSIPESVKGLPHIRAIGDIYFEGRYYDEINWNHCFKIIKNNNPPYGVPVQIRQLFDKLNGTDYSQYNVPYIMLNYAIRFPEFTDKEKRYLKLINFISDDHKIRINYNNIWAPLNFFDNMKENDVVTLNMLAEIIPNNWHPSINIWNYKLAKYDDPCIDVILEVDFTLRQKLCNKKELQVPFEDAKTLCDFTVAYSKSNFGILKIIANDLKQKFPMINFDLSDTEVK